MQPLPRLARPLILAASLLSLAAVAQAPGDVRIALVIGNSAYTGVPPLLNPANDARAMSDALRGMGFKVVEVRDGSRAQMDEAIYQVRDALKGKQGIGMLYYAGHGLQMDARNFMVPVDAKMSKASDVPAQAVEVGSVISAFKAAGNRMNILVLDACRDNPFGGITTGKGLAPLDAPSGTFLAYATAPGNVAEDGDEKSGNGLYTQFLLQELKKPQARIEDVFKRVRLNVRQKSNGRQIPWESTSLEEDFQFNDGRIVAIAKPTGEQLINEFDREKGDWSRIKDSSKPEDFYAFLQKFPNGAISEAALSRLNQLNKPALVVQGAGADGSDKPYTRAEFRLGDTYELVYPDNPAMKERRIVAKVSDSEVAVNVDVLVSNNIIGKSPLLVEYFDRNGAKKGIEGQYRWDPPQNFFPAENIQVGKTWKSGYELRAALFSGMPNQTANGEYKVVARETIKIPAGTIDTFKVEATTYTNLAKNVPQRCTFWMSSDYPVPVKTNCINALPDGKTFPFQSELAFYKRAS